MTNNFEQDTISINQQKLALYSSAIVKRGLDLAKKLQPNNPPSQPQNEQNNQSTIEEFNRIKASFLRGVQNYELGNNQAAIECFSEVLRARPDHVDSLCLRGLSYSDDHAQEALQDFKKLLDIGSESKEIQVLYACGTAQLLLGNSEAATHLLTKVLSTNPNHFKFPSITLTLRAYSHYLFGNKQAALNDLSLALKFNSESVMALFFKGLICHELGNHGQAILDLTAALEINPYHEKSELGFYIRGAALTQMGEYKQAVKDLTKALKINPKHKDAALNLHLRGVAFSHLGDHQKAVRDFVKSLEINPNHELASSGFYLMGLIHYDLKNYYQSIKDLTQALDLKDALSQNQITLALYFRGLAFFTLENYQKAVRDLTKALELNLNHENLVTNLYCRGVAFFKLENYKEAIDDFTQALKINSACEQAALIFYHRGLAYHELGREPEATSDFTRALELNPNILQEMSDS